MFRLSDEYSFANVYVCVYVCVCTSLFSIALKTFYRVCMYREKRERKREKEGGEE